MNEIPGTRKPAKGVVTDVQKVVEIVAVNNSEEAQTAAFDFVRAFFSQGTLTVEQGAQSYSGQVVREVHLTHNSDGSVHMNVEFVDG